MYVKGSACKSLCVWKLLCVKAFVCKTSMCKSVCVCMCVYMCLPPCVLFVCVSACGIFVCASVCVCVSLLSVSVSLSNCVFIFVYFCLESLLSADHLHHLQWSFHLYIYNVFDIPTNRRHMTSPNQRCQPHFWQSQIKFAGAVYQFFYRLVERRNFNNNSFIQQQFVLSPLHLQPPQPACT